MCEGVFLGYDVGVSGKWRKSYHVTALEDVVRAAIDSRYHIITQRVGEISWDAKEPTLFPACLMVKDAKALRLLHPDLPPEEIFARAMARRQLQDASDPDLAGPDAAPEFSDESEEVDGRDGGEPELSDGLDGAPRDLDYDADFQTPNLYAGSDDRPWATVDECLKAGNLARQLAGAENAPHSNTPAGDPLLDEHGVRRMTEEEQAA